MRLRPLYLILLVPALLAAAFGAPAKAPSGEAADRLKAAYIFVEAVDALNDSRIDDAMLLMQRARALDPADIDINASLGELIFATGAGDSVDFARSYEAIRDRFLTNTGNIDNGLRWANLAAKMSRYADVRRVYEELGRTHPERTDFALNLAWVKAMGVLEGDTASLDSAMAIYDRLEQGMGIDPVIVNQRVRALAMASDTAGIIRELDRLYMSAPTDPDINMLVGRTLAAISIPDSAIVYYDRACELDSTNGEAYLVRAEYYLAKGDSSRYDTEVFKALKSRNLDFEPKFEILTGYVRALYEDTSRVRSIGRLFEVMQTIHPGEADLHNLYGSYLATIDSLGQASEQFGYAADLAPDDPYNWQYLIQTAVGAGDTIRAIDAGRKATHRFTDNLYFPFVTSSLIMMTEGAQPALDLIDAFDISEFENPEALSSYHQTRGDLLYKLELTDSAFAEYERALEYNPHNNGAQNNAAYFMACEDVNLDRARSLIEDALRADPGNATYLDTYAWVLFKLKDYPSARLQIDLALGAYGDSTDITPPDPKLNDARPVAEPTDPAAAADVAEVIDSADVEEIEEVIFEQPTAEVYDHAGDIYFMTGEPDQAVRFWQKALDLEPGNQRILKKVKNKAYFFE
ncbi:MAG: tetratricopeptide repeat protein [Bacteroidales bacterium]|nr:tetratricopeptide repeat protein [Bacteroidales bacterium]